MPRPSQLPHLLDAAAAVIRRDGARALTLDAVAVEAGVSKGGLLYHFPEKTRLLAALVERMLDRFEADVAAREAADAQARGRFVRAYLHATLHPTYDDGALAALLAGFAHAPEVLAPWRARTAAWQRRAESDGLPPGEGELLRLAVDGLWLAALAELAPIDPIALTRLVAEKTR